jgi:hypothetical protein
MLDNWLENLSSLRSSLERQRFGNLLYGICRRIYSIVQFEESKLLPGFIL